jgi:hypothetical protein
MIWNWGIGHSGIQELRDSGMEKEATGAVRSPWFWAVFMAGSLLFDIPSASAIQTHGAPEGLYAHQMAHLGFMVAMVYIWLRTRRRAGEGWGLIRLSFVFFAVWNVTTFINHGISATLDSTQFQGHIGPFPEFLVARLPIDLYFFFGQMDHFLCIPAALFLGLGLRKMRQATQHPPSDDVY